MNRRQTTDDITYRFADHHRREGFDRWLVGKLYAFDLDTDRVVCLRAGGRIGSAENPVAVEPAAIALPRLASVCADKALYREADDTVRLLAFAPGAAGGEATLEILLNGSGFAEVQVDLDDQGLGLFELRDPLAGEYAVKLDESEARFTVAAYKLAPLTARLASSSLSERGGVERLEFEIVAETYGAALEGAVRVELMDLSVSPPASRQRMELKADAGRIAGRCTLSGEGPFALQLQARSDAAKTATVPLPGSRKAERDELPLSSWGRERFARGVPFAGATPLRGLYVGERAASGSAAPFKVLAVADGHVTLKARAEIDAWHVASIDPHSGALTEHQGTALDAGDTIAIPLQGDWRLLTAGAVTMGRRWEGTAAVVRPQSATLELEAPRRAEPGAEVQIALTGPAGASAFVLVKDARLQVADTPMSASAASRRRQIAAGRALGADADVTRTLGTLIAPPPPPMPEVRMMARRRGFGFGGGAPRGMPVPAAPPMPMAMAAPVAAEAEMDMMMQESGAAMKFAAVADDPTTGALFDDEDDAFDGPVGADPDAPTQTRESFPEVVFAQIVELDGAGRAQIPVKLGDAMGSVVVEVFAVSGTDQLAATQEILVSKELFGELVLPRFVADGDFAEGRLYVRVHQGRAQVTVRCDGRTVLEREVSAPGETLAFPAAAGDWEAVVSGSIVDRCTGRVDEPGKLVWLQKAVRLLAPGDVVERDLVPGALSLRVLPGLDEPFDRMVGGLRSYAHCCCEQTSSVMLAAAAAWMTASEDGARRDAANHIRACVARMESMYLPGRGFKGWPHYAPEVFCYSPGATLNLLQLDMLSGEKMDRDLKAALARANEMALDAAKAHEIDPAPKQPGSAREAYGRFSKFVSDRQRMAEFIRERVEPWEQEMQAILKFDLPQLQTETYHRTPAMVRCETAFGAAALIELGGAWLKQGLELANTVLGAVQENGSLYSTLDSVAAIALLTSLRRAGIGLGSGGACLVDGEQITGAEAAERGATLRRVEALDDPVQVEIQRLVEEDYNAIDQGVTARVWLERGGKRLRGAAAPGDALELVVHVESGYEAGDFVHVFLPDALSWVLGGGQVKKFSLDMVGEDVLRVPLAATGLTLDADGGTASQRFAVCVRNMYDEERGKGFSDLSVTVTRDGSDEGGLLDRVVEGLRGLFG